MSTSVQLDPRALALERQYTPAEIAGLTKLHPSTIREEFRNLPGVFVFGEDNPRGKRCYTTLRIPESVFVRWYQDRMNKPRRLGRR